MARLERSIRRAAVIERKRDTRHKIQLGGLVIKAGLGNEPPAVILGALIAAAKALSGPNAEATRERLKQEGDKAFTGGSDA
jgi:hypothetical protein